MKNSKLKRSKRKQTNTVFFKFLLLAVGILFLLLFSQISLKNRQLINTKANVDTNASLYEARNRTIYFKDSPITLRGINWYGFESSQHVIQDLSLHNWQKLITRVHDLGFNAVRIPFCPETLRGVPVNRDAVEYYHNRDLVGLNSLEIMDKFVTELDRNNIFILLDHHVIDCITKETSSTVPDLWKNNQYSEDQWIADLTFVANRYKHLPHFMGIDLKNEPHGRATWGTGDDTDWKVAVEKAGKSILQVNSNILIFVEGIGESANCSSSMPHINGSNLEPQKCYPISVDSIPSNKIVFSPHIYGPYVTNNYPSYFKDSNFPQNMDAVWDTHFGYLHDLGYTVVPGEWGSWYQTFGYTDAISKKDKVWMDSLIAYYKKKGICSSFYWALNPYGTGTGGVLDWSFYKEVPEKMAALNSFYSTCSLNGESIPAKISPIANVSVTPTIAAVTPLSCKESYGEYCENWPGAQYYCKTVGRYYGCGSDRYVNTGKDCCTTIKTPTPLPTAAFCQNGISCQCDGLSGRDDPGHCGQCGGSWCDGGFCHCTPPSKPNPKIKASPTPRFPLCVENKVCGCDGLNGRDDPGQCGQCGGAWCNGGQCDCLR